MKDKFYNEEKILECANLILDKCNSLSKFSKKNGKFQNESSSDKSFKKSKGVYLFVKLNDSNKVEKIVRVGTHTADKETSLMNRLKNHLNNSNKASIFRISVSKCKGMYSPEKITEYINQFKILIIEEENKERRLEIERKLIGTLSWAGYLSEKFRNPDEVMKTSDNEFTKNFGLWLEKEMFKEPIQDTSEVEKIFSNGI